MTFCFAAALSSTQSAWLANAGSGKGCSVQKHWVADGSAPAGSCAVTAARYLLLTAVVLDAWYDTQSVVNAVSLAKTLRHVRLEHVFLETGRRKDLREVAVQQRLQSLLEAWPQSSESFFEPDVVFILVADAVGREDLWHRPVVVLRAQLNYSCSDSDNESETSGYKRERTGSLGISQEPVAQLCHPPQDRQILRKKGWRSGISGAN